VKRFLIFIIIAALYNKVSGQENPSSKEMMLEAESDFYYEDYSEALPLYLKLLKADITNDNLNYKVGVCYLNIPYEKEKSIAYLDKASKNINQNYKPDNLKEKQSPPDVLFYLGNAYRVLNQLDKALGYYEQFKTKLDPSVFDESLVTEEINQIDRARKLEGRPVFFKFTNLGETINSKFSESNAVVSGDENVLLYNVKLQFYEALYFSTKQNNEWAAPTNIIPDLGVDGDVYATSVSYDGKELYIYRSDNYDGNIYVSRFVNNKWTPIKRLNDNVNTKYWESHASISYDGKTLYFTSNRKGGYGGLDIYKATRSDISLDDWANVQNLGPQINTPQNEETPFISQDGKVLYFSSYGHYNMGGYDIFYSTLLDDGKWSAPLNMGYPINTTDDDLFFQPVKDANFAYVCRYYPESNYGKTDIYRIEIFSSQHPRKFMLKGLVSIPSELKNEENIQITAKLINVLTRDTLQFISIDPLKNHFDTKLNAGNYKLIYEGKGLQKTSEEFSIDSNQKSDEVTLNSKLIALSKEIVRPTAHVEPTEPLTGLISFNKSFFKVYNPKRFPIEMNLMKGSKISIDIFSDSTFINNKKFIAKRNSFKFDFQPKVGKNILKVVAIGPDNQISKGGVVVYYEPMADTSSNVELKTNLVERQKDLVYEKNMIAFFAGKKLQGQLKKIDTEKENLTSLDELSELLKNHAQYNNYRIAEVDSLIGVYKSSQPEITRLLVNALSYMSVCSFRPIIDSLQRSKSQDDVNGAIKFIFSKSKHNKESNINLLSSSLRLADEGSAFYYYQALKKVATGNLKDLLDTLNLCKHKINNPEDLLNYLLAESPIAGYETVEVLKGFFIIPAFTSSPALLLASMTEISGGKIAAFLKEVHINDKVTKTTINFGNSLLERAEASNISLVGLANLLIKANSNFYFKELVSDLNDFASGKVKVLLSKIDVENEKINSSNELLNFILSHNSDKEIEDGLIREFLQIASKNLIKADSFKPIIEKPSKFPLFNIVLFSALSLLLFIIIFFAVRRIIRKRNEI
jgi:hypothetical protein